MPRAPLKNRFEIFKRDKFTCQYCGRTPPEVKLELDHIVPVSQGGTDDFSNLITSCWECNRGKSDEPLGFTKVRADLESERENLQEKELQLAEYSKLREQIRLREESDLARINARLREITNDKYQLSEMGNRSFRNFLQIFPVEQVLDALDIAASRINYDNQAETLIRYTYGILHNWRKQRGPEER